MPHTVFIPILLTHSYSIYARNSFPQVHCFYCLFLLYTCIFPAAFPGLLKNIYVFWSLLLPSLPPGNGKISQSVIKSILPEEDCWWQWICHPTQCLFLSNWNFFHGEWNLVLFPCLNPGLSLTYQVFIPLSHCHWLIWSLRWLISFKALHIDLIKLACLICVRNFLRMFHLDSDKVLFFFNVLLETSLRRESLSFLPSLELRRAKAERMAGFPAARVKCFHNKQICLSWAVFYVVSPETHENAIFPPLEVVWAAGKHQNIAIQGQDRATATPVSCHLIYKCLCFNWLSSPQERLE